MPVISTQFIGNLNPGRRFTSLGSLALLVVFVATLPLFYVIYNSLQLTLPQWLGLWSSRLPELLQNTLSLAVLVSIGSVILGVSSAWWIARREFPGRKLAVWLMILPLTVPTYVFAHIYTTLLEENGWLGRLWITLGGNAETIPDLYNIWGVTLILSLAGFSYVFILARAALSQSTRTLEEAARIQGASSLEVFWRINL
ncbi:ABC transporter permease, partial [Kaarinaea lacus]